MILDDTSIVLNDLILLRSRAGIATMTEQLLLHFPNVERELQIVRLSELLFCAPLRMGAGAASRPASTGVPKIPSGHRTESPWKSRLKELGVAGVRKYSKWILDPLYRPSLFHEPDMLALPMGRKSLATIPDLSVLLFPQWHPEHRVASYRKYFVEVVARTDRFLSISETSKQDFVRITGIDPRRVTVALLAPRPQFRPQDSGLIESTRRKIVGDQKYFLFLSTLEPRKNILGLLDAWSKTTPQFRKEHRLILAGAWGWKSETLAARLKMPEIMESVQWVGQVSDEDLVPLVAGAQALIYPSFYEGFGLPPLEAMACGTPVISSDRGALREAVGDAALVIDPEDPPQIAEAIQQIGKDPSWKKKGLEHASKYQWRDFAAATARLYRQTLGDKFD